MTRLRFPDGDTEYRSSAKLQVGAVVRTRGGVWVVTSVSEDTATLAPETPSDNGNGATEPAGSSSYEPLVLDVEPA